ncbi:hypothetical protein GALL_457740 [mine drainage metagenome]|uniref:Uncharacterized protein n=1 Tax=mine drainage metagenome TaxID=410659 RepID=A0A1J5Q9E3_9ZZZZ
MRFLVRRRAGLKVADVIAGAECVPRPGQQDGADRSIPIRVLERIHHGGIHRPGQGVFLLRPVELDFQHRPGLAHEDVAHSIFLPIF